MNLIRQLGLLRWRCWFKPHEYYEASFGHCSFDSINGLSDITYSTQKFCKYCHKAYADFKKEK